MDDQQPGLFSDDGRGKGYAAWEEADQEDQLVARIALADPPFGPYDYLVPDHLREELQPGMRVKVSLGRGNRLVIGYCLGWADTEETSSGISRSDNDGGEGSAEHQTENSKSGSVERTLFPIDEPNSNRTKGRRSKPRQLKPIAEIVSGAITVPADLLALAEWIANRYLSHVGQVLDAMIPAAVRGQAGTREQKFFSVPNQVLAQLTKLKLSPKQSEVLKILASSSQPLTVHELARRAGCTTAPVQALRKKGLLEETVQRVAVNDPGLETETRTDALELNEDQQQAFARIKSAIHGDRFEGLLLHGITGSGKTEVYIRAIDEVIGFGRQAIVLVPEISLTPQTKQRFRTRFDRVAVLHSHLSPAERHFHWKMIAAGEIQVVVGARSAIFAPLPNLGMIVLDEEHDPSFKQDNIPRYHARDVAFQRAKQNQVPVVLGSATPSLESWYQYRSKQIHRISMPRRVLDLPLPDVGIIDLRSEFRSRRSKGMISRPLQAAMRDALQAGGQVILMLNRRGFARHIQCPSCGGTVNCPDCEIALTYHRDGERAVCHYCDYTRPTPRRCPSCDFEGIRFAGYGTQKLEDEVQSRFPNHGVLRMDSDSMQKHGSHESALDRFRKQEVDILVGTQMIAKGLDFPNVTLVGVVNADTSLHFPDFRAAERTFSLVTQVAGRSGRGERGGRVLVQTFSPEHPAIEAARRHNYQEFAKLELQQREDFGYPPTTRMVRLVFRGENDELTLAFASQVMDAIRERVDEGQAASSGRDPSLDGDLNEVRLLGPTEAPIAKIRNRYRFHALIQAPQKVDLNSFIKPVMKKYPSSREIEWIVDIDPLEML